ncbi:S-adenosyl-L-methionine-dependent methyltransferase [Infundibulicybe gibba]|nr:S-adenosyl-L-methionine-dependent methyltransferase [Infundibulicybe gibba]
MDRISSEEHGIKATSSVHDCRAEKPPFGSRFLTDAADVWSQNAWDHVTPPEDQVEVITAALARQQLAPVPEADKLKYNEKPAKHWDNFYKTNSNNFFRDRKWFGYYASQPFSIEILIRLHNEFPELVAATGSNAGPTTIAEIGCGAGNSVFPLLSTNHNPELCLRAYDYSTHAVKLVQNNPLYISPPLGTIQASVWDVTSPTLPADVQPGSVDIVILVFVMSALHPAEWVQTITNIHAILKPHGIVVFRDYGRHDLTQLRFKAGRMLDVNFYIRGDKTRVYFFELDELALLFTGSRVSSATSVTDPTNSISSEAEDSASANLDRSSPLPLISQPCREAPPPDTPPPVTCVHPTLPATGHPSHPLFTTEQLGVDRRLLVNRKRQLKMYRVWMQGKFRKNV